MLFIILFIFVIFSINAAQQNRFLIGDRPKSERDTSYVFWESKYKNKGCCINEIQNREAKAIKAIEEKRATVYFNSNDKIQGFLSQYPDKGLTSFKLLREADRISIILTSHVSKNKLAFNNPLNESFLKILEDISNAPDLTTVKDGLMECLWKIEEVIETQGNSPLSINAAAQTKIARTKTIT